MLLSLFRSSNHFKLQQVHEWNSGPALRHASQRVGVPWQNATSERKFNRALSPQQIRWISDTTVDASEIPNNHHGMAMETMVKNGISTTNRISEPSTVAQV